MYVKTVIIGSIQILKKKGKNVLTVIKEKLFMKEVLKI